MLIRHPVLPRNINHTRHVVTNDEKRNCLVTRAPFDRFAKKFSIILYGLQCGILLWENIVICKCLKGYCSGTYAGWSETLHNQKLCDLHIWPSKPVVTIVKYRTLKIESHDRVVSILSYSGGCGFKSRPRDILPLLRFSCFFFSYSR
jgi:hypothetical protein